MNKEQIIDEAYKKYADSHWTPPSNPKGKLLSDQLFSVVPMEHSKESFINKCKTDPEFSERWGLKIEERELSLEERRALVTQEMFNQIYNGGGPESLSHSEINQWNIPTKLLKITYKGTKIESYEN
jgi:hypothetical protein